MRPIPTVVVDEDARPIDWQRLTATFSQLTVALIATGAFLYFARELLIPIVTAFVVGVMMSPVARRLEDYKIPRVLSAALIVLCTALIIGLVVLLIASPVAELGGKLPQIGEKLRSFGWVLDFIHRVERSLGVNPSDASPKLPGLDWAPAAIGYVSVPLTGFLYFLVVLLLFISWWPDLRRQMVMTFASRDSRLTALRIVNETEQALAGYLLTVACINRRGRRRGRGRRWATGLPFPIGFGALAATLNFIPILGPLLMIARAGDLRRRNGADTWRSDLLPAGLFMIVVFVEGQFVTPAIIGRRHEINSLAVLLVASLLGLALGADGRVSLVAASDRRADPHGSSEAGRRGLTGTRERRSCL